MGTYRVQITAGPYTWTVTDDDPPGYGLADPLVISWSVPTDAVRPAQPDPIVCQFRVVAAHAGDVRLGLGDQVLARVWFAADRLPPVSTDPDVWFRGRITDATAEPSGAGILYAFTCSDQTIDLTGADIGALDQQPLTWTQRLINYTAAAAPALAGGLVMQDPRIAAGVDANLWVDLRDGSPDTVLDAVSELFGWTAFTGVGAFAGNTFYMPIVAPGPGPLGMQTYPIAYDALPDRFIPTAGAPGPATFANKGTCYGVVVNPDDRTAGVIDACFVERSAGWTAFRADVVNTAVVAWATAVDFLPTSDRTPQTTRVTENPPATGRAPVISTRETGVLGLTNTPATVTAAQNNANRLGHLMTPPFQFGLGWSPDGFTWRLDRDPLGRESFPVLFPQSWRDAGNAAGQAMRTVAYVRPVVVANVPPTWNPLDPTATYVYGQLSEVVLTIAAGAPVIDFTLTPTLPEVGSPGGSTNSWNQQSGTWNAQSGTWDELVTGYLTFRWNDPGLVGVTWNQLCPDDSWFEYQLLRGS